METYSYIVWPLLVFFVLTVTGYVLYKLMLALQFIGIIYRIFYF